MGVSWDQDQQQIWMTNQQVTMYVEYELLFAFMSTGGNPDRTITK
jgi:hypothetical protein